MALGGGYGGDPNALPPDEEEVPPVLPPEPPPIPEQPLEMMGAGPESDVFSAPMPEVPLSLPPSIPGFSGGAGAGGATRSFLPLQPKQRRIPAGPGTPMTGEGLGEDDRMKMILNGLGLGGQ